MNLLKLKTRSQLKRNKTMRNNVPYSAAVTVGIIFSVEDKQKHDIVKDFIKKLEHDGKKVTVISFLPKNKENYEFLFDFFTEKDLTFWGTITSPNAITFSETPFDYLYYLDKEPNPMIMNLLAKSKAKCRVGKFYNSYQPYFELMIESNDETRGLADNMYQYTRSLR